MIECYQHAAAGRLPDLTRLERVSRTVAESVRRSPDALLYFVRTQTAGDYLYRHGVACAVMLCAMGHSMGKSFQSLKTLTLGGALLDIGKTRVSSELLNRPRATELTPGELQQLRRHVERGAEIVSQITSEGGPLVTMIMSHHERFDGSGYPRKLSGDYTAKFGQMAAIVDMFDAMISERSYGRRATPYEAMRYIQSQKDKEFSAELVVDFRKAFGTYPTGTLVELSTGEVGNVIQQSEFRLQPRVYVLLDKDKTRLCEFQTIDLSAPENRKNCIEQCLKPGSY
jgi:HD-GYP domain-containing protein (c-di-GMP phosphodiesterase class II)